ncbi:hypothetical protein CesoFtcFv8_008121 [Champsocephalus esox]|uniref:Uncharacterized protein n=1 Tax=Champsocephalus esox TaxID=159716 RepID=A0AAN8CI85_9TELE|nr:hypothetical protein CesoFtcFv8_008121 [Champsocephalus esox]
MEQTATERGSAWQCWIRSMRASICPTMAAGDSPEATSFVPMCTTTRASLVTQSNLLVCCSRLRRRKVPGGRMPP